MSPFGQMPTSDAPQGELRLYHYWRSSSSWRVRFGLAFKGVGYTPIAVNLINGESDSPAHLARNPAGSVPVLEWAGPGGGIRRLTESLAILQFIDTVFPKKPFLPADPYKRAQVWALAETVNAGIQPLQNLPVFLKHSNDPSEQKKWNQHWIRSGLEVYEKLAASLAGRYSFGNDLTLADLCLIPQLYNAERFEVGFDDLPTLVRVQQSCMNTQGYAESHPDRFKPISDFA